MAGMLLCPVSGWLKSGECNERGHRVHRFHCDDANSRQMKIKKDKLNYRRD